MKQMLSAVIFLSLQSMHGLAAPLSRRVSSFTSPLQWINGPVKPADSASPYAGAAFLYARTDLGCPGSDGAARSSPFNLEVMVWDKNNVSIQGRPSIQAVVTNAFRAIYLWNSTEWRAELAERWPTTEKEAILNNKSNFFWEELAQQLAQRVLYGGEEPPASTSPSTLSNAAPIDMFGPQCTTPTGNLTCSIPAANGAARIGIRTTVEASRDDLMPVTRQIYLFVTKAPFCAYDVTYAVGVSDGITVASPFHEHLDIRPHVGQLRLNTSLTVLADSPEGRQFYPDYNLLFIPLRHLAFQGAVPNPREPGSSLAYSSRSGLESDVMQVLGMMRRPETAAIIAKELAPFFTAQYYYMFNYFNFSAANISGVAGYKKQTLSMIGAGFQGSIGAVELQFGDTILV